MEVEAAGMYVGGVIQALRHRNAYPRINITLTTAPAVSFIFSMRSVIAKSNIRLGQSGSHDQEPGKRKGMPASVADTENWSEALAPIRQDIKCVGKCHPSWMAKLVK
jgi:hypothetical protein